MDVYVCLVFDADCVIVDSATIPGVNNDGEAQAQGFALVRNVPGARGFELWLDGQKVYAHPPDGAHNPARVPPLRT